MPKISVIVPVYKVEDYLEKCVASILGQSCGDFELLLVDDGSPDGCPALCDRLAESDPRVRVIHQENMGLGGARNTGISQAAGDWVLPVDSDDWIEPDTLEKALAAGEKHNAAMVVFGFRTVDEAGRVLRNYVESEPKDSPLLPLEHKSCLLINPCAWNKLCRRELFADSGILYPSRVWYEDIRTSQKLLALLGREKKTVVFLDEVCYNYLQRAGSIMNSGNLSRNQEILWAFEDLLGWFEEQGLSQTWRDELEFLTVSHVYLGASVRVARIDPKSPLLGDFAAFLGQHFPDWKKNPYLAARLTTLQRRVLLPLLGAKQYGLIRLLFSLRGQ